MKKLLTAMCCLAATVSGFAQVSYTINGKVNPSDEGKKVYLYVAGSRAQIDSAVIKNNAFILKGSTEKPDFAFVSIVKGKTSFSPLYLENGSVASFQAGESVAALTEGTATDKALNAFTTEFHPLSLEQRKVQMEAYQLMQQNGGKLPKAQEDSINAVWDKLSQKAGQVVLAHVNKSLHTYAPALLLAQYGSLLETADKKKVLDAQGPYQHTTLVKDMKVQLAAEALTSEGKPFIDFTMNDIDGKPHKLSEYVGTGKYVLIDFWASWCGPCRSEMPNVKKVYDTYKDKGFDIVGISLDSNKAAWQKGINDLGITWHQLSDLKGWKNEGAAKYAVRAIPATFLVDPKGKIIAKNLRGDELGKKLAEVLK